MGELNKVLIIQPHSDDAILSCAKFIFDTSFKTKILTIEQNPSRVEEDDNLYKFIGINTINLKTKTKDDYYSEFFKVNGRNAVLTDKNVISFYEERIGRDNIRKLKEEIHSVVEKYIDYGYMILCPLGIGHPYHYLVRYLLRDIEDGFIFYREFPHSYKRKAKSQLDSELLVMSMVCDNSDEEINKLKYTLAQKFYKTQSGFFFYEHSNIEKLYSEEFFIKDVVENKETSNIGEKQVKVYVISKDRPDGKTFEILNKGGVPYTVVVEPQDVEKYREFGHKNILVLPENDRGFSYTVNYSKNQFDGVNPVMIMDDDIMSLYLNLDGVPRVSPSMKTEEDFKGFFDGLMKEICATDFEIGTIGKSAFDWNVLNVNPRIACPNNKVKYSGLPVVIIINSKKLLKFDFDEDLCFKSDVDYSLKCMYLGLKYAKFIKYTQQTKMNKDGKQTGGLSETYKKQENLINAQKILLERWPDNIVIDEKKKANNGVAELRIIYKCSKNIPSFIKDIQDKIDEG